MDPKKGEEIGIESRAKKFTITTTKSFLSFVAQNAISCSNFDSWGSTLWRLYFASSFSKSYESF